MRVVVTRPAAEGAAWVDGLRAAGFDAVALPLIEIREVPDSAEIAQSWSRLGEFRAAMFVSANAVRGFFVARPAGAAFPIRAWATGPATVDALAAAGVDRMLIDAPPDDSPSFDSEALWQRVGSQVGPGDRVLLVRGGEAPATRPSGRDWLQAQLAGRGAQPVAVLAYLRAQPRWTAADRELAARALAEGDVWLFSSSQAIANLRALAPSADLSRAKAIATHPRIGQAASEAGFAVVRVSRPPMDAVIADLESTG